MYMQKTSLTIFGSKAKYCTELKLWFVCLINLHQEEQVSGDFSCGL